MTASRRDPIAIGDALAQVRRNLGLGRSTDRSRLLAHWSEIVGPGAVDEIRPGAIRDGVLTLLARDPVWAGQFRYRAPAVLDAVTAVLGPGVVREVAVRVGEVGDPEVGDRGEPEPRGGGLVS